MLRHCRTLVTGLLLSGLCLSLTESIADAQDEQPIAIAEIKRDAPVEFEKEVLPILRRNCLACHNSAEAESDLVLETPQSIIKGGAEGPAAVAGNGAESLIIKLASRQRESYMPPDDNDVKAKRLTSEELGLIKLWIDQGAKGDVAAARGPIQWQPLPPGVNPIYAVALSPDGQYAAAGRANQIFLYHIPSKRELGRLTDPEILNSGAYSKPGVAHLDLVQSLKFSPDSQVLASGGYRNVKLWSRVDPHQADLPALESKALAIAVDREGKRAAFGLENGKVQIVDLAAKSVIHALSGHGGPVTGVQFTADGTKIVSASKDKSFRVWDATSAAEISKIETPSEVNALVLLNNDTQIATGGADNVIRIWAVAMEKPAAEPPAADAPAAEEPAAEQPPAEQPPADAPPAPLKEISGHSQPVTSLAAINEGQIVSGSADGTVRHWNAADGNQIRQMNHGGPVESVAVRSDNARIASASSNNTVKLWDAANGQQVAEMKGELGAKLELDDMNRSVALAKRKIDLAKADLKSAEDRKKSEDENAKSAEEAKKKAEEEFNKKTEEAKKPVEEKEAADKALADATKAQTDAEEAKKKAEADLPVAVEAENKAKADLDAKAKAAEEAAKAAQQAADKQKQAQEAANNDADNKELADAAATAQKALEEAEAKKKAADEEKAAAEKAFAEAQEKKKAAEQAKQNADKALTDAQNKFKAAEADAKKKAEAAEKALNEKNAAERAMQAAERSVVRAGEAVKKAEQGVADANASVTVAEERHKQEEASLEGAKTTATESEKPYHAVAFSSDGAVLAAAGEGGVVQTFDSSGGSAIDTYAGQGAAITALASAPGAEFVSAAANNTALVWLAHRDWTLVRTIGSPASSDQFVDRITALDFSPDGQLLATGGGEPSRNGELKLWNVADGALVREIPEAHSDTVFSVEFSPEGEFIASSAADRFMKVFRVADGQFVRAYEGHTHHVLGVSWSSDGRTLATGGADNVVKVWDVETGDQKRTISGFNKEVTSVHFVGDGEDVIASCGDSSINIKRTSNGGNVRGFGGASDFVHAAHASADGKTIIAGGQDSIVRVWSDNGQVIATFEPPKVEQTASTEGG